MATFTVTATERRANANIVPAKGPAYSMKTLVSTVTTAADASVGTTYDFGNIPSNARISGLSRVYSDDLATTGSPTLDIGLAEVNGNLANSDDPDALSNGHAISSAVSDALLVTDISNIGLPAWDHVTDEASDPGGELTVYGSIADAAITAIASDKSITIELVYYVD